jgi:hypothetical protein
MRRNAKKKTPDIVFREGKPVAVILDIDEYQELLKRLEDKHDFMTYTRLWPFRNRPFADQARAGRHRPEIR